MEEKKPPEKPFKEELKEARRARETLGSRFESVLKEIDARSKEEERLLQSSKTHLIKPHAEKKKKALEAARKARTEEEKEARAEWDAARAAADVEFNERLRSNQAKFEAVCDAAREEFYKASNELSEELKAETKALEKKAGKLREKAGAERRRIEDELDARIAELELKIEELRKKPRRRKGSRSEAST